ncbi:MAG TPA: tetratricopeptide repeat protein [Verrucomicrobiae bacterium]|nr:tetratricopeptide repeat protein [Verrucomicrobiae bacterium]
MKQGLLKFFGAMVCASLLAAQSFAEDTNSVSASTTSTNSDALMNAYVQLQAQLHTMQMQLDQSRADAATAAQRNTDALNALEQKIITQHNSEIAAEQNLQQLTLAIAGAFGAAGLAAMLLLVYFQWRTVTRFAELSTFVSERNRALPMAEMVGQLAAPGRAAVESANMNLLGVVERLEKRILELEHNGHPALAASTAPKHQNGSAPDATDREECIANLIAEGQSLLADNEPEKALECFEVALNLEPRHAEALVKKGGALEKMGRTDEAIACYDRAIEANSALTIAYLQKGGLFNRLARYDEALQCYERALHTQDKKTVAEKTAA